MKHALPCLTVQLVRRLSLCCAGVGSQMCARACACKQAATSSKLKRFLPGEVEQEANQPAWCLGQARLAQPHVVGPHPGGQARQRDSKLADRYIGSKTNKQTNGWTRTPTHLYHLLGWQGPTSRGAQVSTVGAWTRALVGSGCLASTSWALFQELCCAVPRCPCSAQFGNLAYLWNIIVSTLLT